MIEELQPRRFDLYEIIQVPEHGSACLGRISGHEDGRNLAPAFLGWAYHIGLLAPDGESERVVIVGEEQLQK
jgi:hypothetical protein